MCAGWIKVIFIIHSTTTTNFTALSLGLLGEPVPEKNINPLTPIMIINHLLSMSFIHSILPVQSVCLTVFLHNLCPSPLVYFWVWNHSLHIPYISSSSHYVFCNTCPYHHKLFCCNTNIIFSIFSLSLISLLGIFYFNVTHPYDHSHLCPLMCHLICFP